MKHATTTPPQYLNTTGRARLRDDMPLAFVNTPIGKGMTPDEPQRHKARRARVKVPPFEILVDTREQAPLVFDGVPARRATLATGDYSLSGYADRFTVERKSLPDLVHSVLQDRERFENELARAARWYDFRGLVIVSSYARVARGEYEFSMANPRSVIASINAFEIRYGLHVAFCSNPAEAARRVYDWCYYYARERARLQQEDL